MKRVLCLILSAVLLLGLAACGSKPTETVEPAEKTEPAVSVEEPKGPTWQEQYDLGLRFLSEGNYKEAILAFTVAIQIDPKRADAYVERGNAYIGSGETAENSALTKAFAAPVRISSREVRPPSTAFMASITMDLPAPVSPVRALNPGKKRISASSMTAIFSI